MAGTHALSMSGSIPRSDEENRRWYPFWNSTDEEIPARGCVWCAGKRFGGKWSEKNLPKEGDPSWDELQSKVGYGNLILVGRKPYAKYGWALWNQAGFYFNGPTAVPPKSWGRCTRDFPAIARVRSAVKEGSGLAPLGETGLYFRPGVDTWDLVNASDGSGPFAWGWTVGWGWGGMGLGGRWIYGSPPSFWMVDLIDGFDKSEGLAWVSEGKPPEGPKGFRILINNGTISEGDNDVALLPLAYGDTSNSLVVNGDVLYEDPTWLSFKTPGIYELDIQLGLSGGTDGPAADGENPYSQIEITVESDDSVSNLPTVSYTAARVTLAPPVLKQGAYGVDTTYITQYESARVLVTMIIPEPDDYDPSEADPPVLARLKLNVHRTTNHAVGMGVQIGGNGIGVSQGANPENSSSADSSVVNP